MADGMSGASLVCPRNEVSNTLEHHSWIANILQTSHREAFDRQSCSELPELRPMYQSLWNLMDLNVPTFSAISNKKYNWKFVFFFALKSLNANPHENNEIH